MGGGCKLVAVQNASGVTMAVWITWHSLNNVFPQVSGQRQGSFHVAPGDTLRVLPALCPATRGQGMSFAYNIDTRPVGQQSGVDLDRERLRLAQEQRRRHEEQLREEQQQRLEQQRLEQERREQERRRIENERREEERRRERREAEQREENVRRAAEQAQRLRLQEQTRRAEEEERQRRAQALAQQDYLREQAQRREAEHRARMQEAQRRRDEQMRALQQQQALLARRQAERDRIAAATQARVDQLMSQSQAFSNALNAAGNLILQRMQEDEARRERREAERERREAERELRLAEIAAREAEQELQRLEREPAARPADPVLSLAAIPRNPAPGWSPQPQGQSAEPEPPALLEPLSERRNPFGSDRGADATTASLGLGLRPNPFAVRGAAQGPSLPAVNPFSPPATGALALPEPLKDRRNPFAPASVARVAGETTGEPPAPTTAPAPVGNPFARP